MRTLEREADLGEAGKQDTIQRASGRAVSSTQYGLWLRSDPSRRWEHLQRSPCPPGGDQINLPKIAAVRSLEGL